MSLLLRTSLFSDSPWVVTGGSPLVDGQHNPLSALECDGVDNKAQGTGQISTGSTMSGACWFFCPTGGNGTLLSQYVSGAQGQYIIRIHSGVNQGKLNTSMLDSGGVNAFGRTTTNKFDSGTWRYALVTSGPTPGAGTLLYVDNVLQAATSGGTFSGFGTTLAPITSGIRGDGGDVGSSGFLTDRVTVWDHILTTEERDTEYANEVAAIGEGFNLSSQLGGKLYSDKSLYS